jgi:hypothetical protein
MHAKNATINNLQFDPSGGGGVEVEVEHLPASQARRVHTCRSLKWKARPFGLEHQQKRPMNTTMTESLQPFVRYMYFAALLQVSR